MIRARALLIGMAVLALATARPARAQDEPPAVVPIVLRPALAPAPALKYRLLPERETLLPGNAAIFYHRANEILLIARRVAPSTDGKRPAVVSDDQAVAEWNRGPIALIPLEQAHEYLNRHRSALHEAELGARRQSCDWEFDSRTEGIQLRLQEIHEIRTLARLVVLRVRVAIRDQKLDEAIHWLQTGQAMARHVSEGPILIQTLVGIAISSNFTKPMEDLIQSPGTPSLYWALANRPRPLIDLARALEGERLVLEREVPQLRELDGPPWSVQEARAFTDALQTKLFAITGMGAPEHPGSPQPRMKDWSLKMSVVGLVAQAYPEARRALIAQKRPLAEVDAMPTVQVAALYAFQSYQKERDDLFKWSGLPYYQSYKGLSESSKKFGAERRRKPFIVQVFGMLLANVQPASLAGVRIERQLDALQCIEAVRIHAAAHGKLPTRLEDIIEAPVPVDPATGQPFAYRADGDRATLSASYPPGAPHHPTYAINYELKLSPAGK